MPTTDIRQVLDCGAACRFQTRPPHHLAQYPGRTPTLFPRNSCVRHSAPKPPDFHADNRYPSGFGLRRRTSDHILASFSIFESPPNLPCKQNLVDP